MIEAIRAGKFKRKDGTSADGSVTGRGYLVPWERCLFVRRWFVPWHLFSGFAWVDATDEEAGARAEEIVYSALELGHIGSLEPLRDLARQYAGEDFAVTLASSFSIEIKLDRLASQTGNLFVQTAERGHKHGMARSD